MPTVTTTGTTRTRTTFTPKGSTPTRTGTSRRRTCTLTGRTCITGTTEAHPRAILLVFRKTGGLHHERQARDRDARGLPDVGHAPDGGEGQQRRRFGRRRMRKRGLPLRRDALRRRLHAGRLLVLPRRPAQLPVAVCL